MTRFNLGALVLGSVLLASQAATTASAAPITVNVGQLEVGDELADDPEGGADPISALTIRIYNRSNTPVPSLPASIADDFILLRVDLNVPSRPSLSGSYALPDIQPGGSWDSFVDFSFPLFDIGAFSSVVIELSFRSTTLTASIAAGDLAQTADGLAAIRPILFDYESSTTPVPEPASLALVSAGIALAGVVRRRSR